jgi:hypothetical protein
LSQVFPFDHAAGTIKKGPSVDRASGPKYTGGPSTRDGGVSTPAEQLGS